MTTETEPRRHDPARPVFEDLHEELERYLGGDAIARVETAYDYAAHAHREHQRASGWPYIEHPLAAAVSCAGLQLEVPVLQAALLHDVVEDCGVTHQELSDEFSEEVAVLVDGVTKLSGLSLASGVGGEEAQAENLRKMFIAMAEDVRVVIVKLADRLHNMRTLDALEPEKQVRIAAETKEIYAPLAARLGIWQFKWELEDLAFRYLDSRGIPPHRRPGGVSSRHA